jgi:predicted small lipoprotein YifL
MKTTYPASAAILALAVALAGCGDTGTAEEPSAVESSPSAAGTSTSPSVVASTPAPAASPGELTDPTGDIWVDGVDEQRPGATVDTDVTSLAATYDGEVLTVRVQYAEPLQPDAVNDRYLGFVVDTTPETPGGKLEVLRWLDERRVEVSDSEDVRHGCKTSAMSDLAAGSVTVTVSADCLDNPDRVAVGAAYASSQVELDGDWVIDTVGTSTAKEGPYVEAAQSR